MTKRIDLISALHEIGENRQARAVLLDCLSAAQWCRMAATNLGCDIAAEPEIADLIAMQDRNRQIDGALQRAIGSPTLDGLQVQGRPASIWCGLAGVALLEDSVRISSEISARQAAARDHFAESFGRPDL